ncbi:MULTISPECIES: imm11 family protein [unclassified Psychrobacillus]|uniref:imm11 family protein n=1 Tax=unclassified Psychrobacillus TaxID=2636677 RepID=UPI0030FB3C97
MKYFKLILDDSNDNDVVVHCEDTHGFEQYELKEGNFLESWNDNITFYFNLHDGNRFTDYLANNLGWFIVSKKFKDLIKKIEEDVQFLPVNVVDFESKSKIVNDEYFVANVLGVVDALNLQNSDYSVVDLDGEKIYSVRKYAVSEDKINNKNLFKLKGDEIPLFMSEDFKQLVEKSNITGCEFLEIRNI